MCGWVESCRSRWDKCLPERRPSKKKKKNAHSDALEVDVTAELKHKYWSCKAKMVQYKAQKRTFDAAAPFRSRSFNQRQDIHSVTYSSGRRIILQWVSLLMRTQIHCGIPEQQLDHRLPHYSIHRLVRQKSAWEYGELAERIFKPLRPAFPTPLQPSSLHMDYS